ncbi:MAG: xylulokinase [Mesorhizobium sp.]
MRDIVVGIDASTTSVKAIAFDRHGRELLQARESYPLSNPHPGHFEQDPEDWWSALLKVLRTLADGIGTDRIAAMAIAHQRETFTLLDARGAALVPAILWLDERARPQVARLSARFGRDQIREWTGKPPDPTPALYALAWLAEHRPEAMEKATAVADVNAFLALRLTGRLVTAAASADPLGLLDMASRQWQPELVQAAGLRPEQMPGLVPPGSEMGRLREDVARQIGLPSGLPLFAGAGDGQAMGLGMGVVGEGKSYLSLGSGIVGGTYSRNYVNSDAFRTLVSPSGGFMLETVLRSGMQLVEWIVRTTGRRPVAALEAESRVVAPGSGNLLVLPYWAGVMSPYWDEAARGAIFGLSLDHTPAHLFRAALEGVAFEQALATEALEEGCGRSGGAIVAAGGGTQSALLMEIMASALERPIAISPVNEAAALGAAMLAAAGLGWHADVAAASLAMSAEATRQVEPTAEFVAAYRARKPIYQMLYHATRNVNHRMAEIE